jgi:integrase
MPKPRIFELIQCAHFRWRLSSRDGVWYADGRSNQPNAGRHSLGTRVRDEALRLLKQLDVSCAVAHGLIEAPQTQAKTELSNLSLEDGRKLYEQHIGRSIVTGGVSEKTKKSYRKVFDKFVPFSHAKGVHSWNDVDERLLTKYAGMLETTKHRRDKVYEPKTILNELVTLKQTIKWMIDAGNLPGKQKLHLPLKKLESERTYCYRQVEVAAIVERCKSIKHLNWIGQVVTALYSTGLRIDELANLRWSAINMEKPQLVLCDETAHASRDGQAKQQLKSRRSRMFPIHADFHAVLQELYQLPRKDAFVFHGPRGGRLKPDTVRRQFVEEVIQPLEHKFPSADGEKGFATARFHSFRHFFCSFCANRNTPERTVMEWLGHRESEMIRHYYHLHDEESRRHMDSLDFLGEAGKRPTGNTNGTAVQSTEESSGRESSASIAS